MSAVLSFLRAGRLQVVVQCVRWNVVVDQMEKGINSRDHNDGEVIRCTNLWTKSKRPLYYRHACALSLPMKPSTFVTRMPIIRAVDRAVIFFFQRNFWNHNIV